MHVVCHTVSSSAIRRRTDSDTLTSKAGSRADSKLSRKDEGSCALTASLTVSFTLSLIFAEMLGTRSRRICSDNCDTTKVEAIYTISTEIQKQCHCST